MNWLFLGFMIFNTAFFQPIEKRHAFHLSKTDIVFKPTDKTVQITMHIFIDDLEAALVKTGATSLFIGTAKEKIEAKTLIFNYLQSKFTVDINNKKIKYDFIGKEITTDKQAIWIYLEIKNIKNIKTLTVSNSVLIDLHSDQKNIIQVLVPTKKQGYTVLDKAKTSDVMTF